MTRLPCIQADVAITRRIKMHHAFDGESEPVGSFPDLGEALFALYDLGHTKVIIVGENRHFTVEIVHQGENASEADSAQEPLPFK